MNIRTAGVPRLSLAGSLRAALVLAVALSAATILYATAETTRTAEGLAVRSLESTALSLAAAAESALGGGLSQEGFQGAFSDRVVAYALLADRRGRVLFHTTPELVGGSLPGAEVRAWFSAPRPGGRRISLGTGAPASEFEYPAHLAEGGPQLLRVVVHASPVDRIARQTKRLWGVVSATLALLCCVGVALERAVTRQVRLQQDVERAERLGLIGQMTASLAHEIRNALGSIKGFAQWVDEKTGASDPTKTALRVILSGVGRIEALVDDLLAFSREEVCEVDRVSVAELLEEAARLGGGDWPGTVELGAADGLEVQADRERLLRALVNAVRNAVQAQGAAGRVLLTAEAQGRWVVLRVEDRGPGLSPEAEARVFTPFFTTKADGTGLGLAYSRKVVEAMGGTVELANRPGGGALLTIRLRKA